MSEAQLPQSPHIISTEPAVGIVPVPRGSPITVIGTNSIRAGSDSICLLHEPVATQHPRRGGGESAVRRQLIESIGHRIPPAPAAASAAPPKP